MKRKFMNILDKLSREEMRTIMGGYGEGGYGSGSCGWISYQPGGGSISNCGVSREEALANYNVTGSGNWCCDSCSSSSYCG